MKRSLIILILGFIAGGIFFNQIDKTALMAQAKNGSEDKNRVYEQLNLFGEVFDRIRSGYVEDVNSSDLISAAIRGMLTSLDPHSGYMPPESFQDMQVDTRGAFGGLGIEVTQEDGFVKVVSPMDGTPASEAGIQSGDFITHVDGEAILGLTLSEAVDKMRGPVGSEVSLTIVRNLDEEPFDIVIIRDVIKLTAARVRVEDDVIIVRVTTFNEQTTPNIKKGIKEKIDELSGKDNVSGFIIDLRNNPGGLLSEAISVSDMFLNQGEIVSTRGRNNGQAKRYSASKGDLAENKPIIVLINGGSASASEIVAGALQDHKRAVILGTKSFGKGSVQSVIPLGENGAMRLTTARYYTPSGRSIQALGVVPDIIVEQLPRLNKEKEEDEPSTRITEADLKGALSNDRLSDEEKELLAKEKKIQLKKIQRRKTDNQLSFALDVISGLNIYGRNN
ncbi:MAG: peptidase S41 [Rhodobacterales bacterium]|jgi:carboxyl-terminal processing protease|nr:peptidase S41 [Rhodobacterales bacterium]|tara:strand:+ start:38 stop:1381 length:1344 start_codon:yes stop_codon:yes gene_type:complete